ncbi:hypothetical protein ACIQK6_05895 [Streptomyces sp. NPDC091682]|uniref:hypothetical protein n=1 Tax=Streptomyces sp. NPDC091682 TaxID=3366005 RepID=UPI0038142804
MRSDFPRRGRSGSLPGRRILHVCGAFVVLTAAVAGLAGTAESAPVRTASSSAVAQADPGPPNRLCPPWVDCGPLLTGPLHGRPPHHEDGPPQPEDAPPPHEDGPPPHEGHDGHKPAHVAEIVGDPVTVAPGDEGTVFATCPAGSTLLSGGYLMSGTMQVLLTSRAATPDTWTVTVLNSSTASATVAAVAQCDRIPGPSARP